MAKSFDELLDGLKPHITEISERYSTQKSIIDDLNEATTQLLEKYSGDDSLLSKLDEYKEKLNVTGETLDELNKKFKNDPYLCHGFIP
jgi:uncharacterized coiled-coil DUF342 family protein